MYGKPTLSLDAISIERGGRQLISDLSLELNGPKLLWVVGGNGIGKTSLLRTCAGLSQAADGNVSWTLDGAPVSAPQCVSFLPSEPYAKAGLLTHEEAAFWNIDLTTTGLSEQTHTQTHNLSTGQAKRLSFAKILADKKPIWILDEPLAGLDEYGRQLIAVHLQTHVKTGGLALIASHAPIAVNDIPTQRLALG